MGSQPPSHPELQRHLTILAVCLAFQACGMSLLFTVFARKINTLGGGVAIFGLSNTVFSLAALVAAPFMGALADIFGRRRLLLFSLAANVFGALAYLLAPDAATFIAVRGIFGALTGGMVPATISMIGDLSPEADRGRWIGFVSGWSSAGFILGPPLGGWIYDQGGLAWPFLSAASAHLLALLIAVRFIPVSAPHLKDEPGSKETHGFTGPEIPKVLSRLRQMLPVFSPSLLVLGLISFSAVFAWRFVEPQFHFYIYDFLDWTSARFGLVMSGYAVLLMLAETTLAGLSDRLGRKPLLMIGLVIHTAQYAALITTDSVGWITLGIATSGLGEGLFMPVLNALFLDITPQDYHGRAIGFKESMFSLAGLAGPALVVLAVQALQPLAIFAISGGVILFSALLVPFISLRARRKAQATP